MTHRTELNPPTPIELATEIVVRNIEATATTAHANGEVGKHFTLAQFKRILALYFADKSVADWCRDLGIPDASDTEKRR